MNGLIWMISMHQRTKTNKTRLEAGLHCVHPLLALCRIKNHFEWMKPLALFSVRSLVCFGFVILTLSVKKREKKHKNKCMHDVQCAFVSNDLQSAVVLTLGFSDRTVAATNELVARL